MELDPLADAPPPRYAIESDDEDESYDPTSPSDQTPEVKVEFKSIHEIPLNQPIVFASGKAGVSWAGIVNLGEEQVGIYVNALPVGALFQPSWTNAVVIVSEAESPTQLPLFAMTKYTAAIVERLEPTKVAILDSYAIQGYVSSQVISQDNAPIRYLSIGDKPVADPDLELFAPPNLSQSTTSSLMNELFLRSTDNPPVGDNATMILLPSPKTSSPPPSTFGAKNTARDFDDVSWDRNVLEKVHKWLFNIVGENVGESSLREKNKSVSRHSASVGVKRQVHGEVGEGSMYI